MSHLGTNETWACTTEELLVGHESRTVEYKQTARWIVREQRRDKAMEGTVVKTVASILNDRGGSLLIGVTDSGEPVGLADDYAQVKPPNVDGLINWLDTLFKNRLGHAGTSRIQIVIEQVAGHDICRLNIPASYRPIWVKSKSAPDTLYHRLNNSTRAIPPAEIPQFITHRFGS